MKEIGREDFYEIVPFEKEAAVIFTAPWCSFCHTMLTVAKAVEELTQKEFLQVDIDREKELAESFGVMSVPTTVIFSMGEVLRRKTGLLKKSELLGFVEKKETVRP